MASNLIKSMKENFWLLINTGCRQKQLMSHKLIWQKILVDVTWTQPGFFLSHHFKIRPAAWNVNNCIVRDG
jgi:hypothetical protein